MGTPLTRGKPESHIAGFPVEIQFSLRLVGNLAVPDRVVLVELLKIGAVFNDLIDHLVHDLKEVLVALRYDARLAEGSFFGSEGEVCNFELVVAGDHAHADRVVTDETGDVAVDQLECEGRIGIQLEQLF